MFSFLHFYKRMDKLCKIVGGYVPYYVKMSQNVAETDQLPSKTPILNLTLIVPQPLHLAKKFN